MMDRAGSKTPLSKFTAFLVILCFSALTTWLLHLVVSYSRNTWNNHEEWVNGKTLMDGWLMGAKLNYFARNQFYQNRLNLHEWHGCNEILLNKILRPGSIEFRVNLAWNGYVSVIYDKTSDSFSGIRLSRDQNIPSIYFRSTADGKYLQKELIQNVKLGDGWNNVDLQFKSNRASLHLNDKPIGDFPYADLQEQVVGFRSGYRSVIMDDVKIHDASGKLVIEEDFSNRAVDWWVIVISFSIQAVLAAVLLGRARQIKKVFFSMLVFEFTLVAVLLAYFCFDWYVWSRRYHPRKGVGLVQVKSRADWSLPERVRNYAFRYFPFYEGLKEPDFSRVTGKLEKFLRITSNERMLPEVSILRFSGGSTKIDLIERSNPAIKSYLNQSPLRGKVIMLLGSSQTFGNGAIHRRDRMGYIVFENLKRRMPSTDFVLINGSEAGSHSRLLLDDCRNFLYLFRPEIVLINLANNDPMNYKEAMSSMLDWFDNQGTKPVLIEEANSSENIRKHILRRHKILRDLARSRNLPIIDLHEHLANRDTFDSGILWWDVVHLTPYGQQLAGDYIAEKFMEKIPLQ